jgi:hypothetical protein
VRGMSGSTVIAGAPTSLMAAVMAQLGETPKVTEDFGFQQLVVE